MGDKIMINRQQQYKIPRISFQYTSNQVKSLKQLTDDNSNNNSNNKIIQKQKLEKSRKQIIKNDNNFKQQQIIKTNTNKKILLQDFKQQHKYHMNNSVYINDSNKKDIGIINSNNQKDFNSNNINYSISINNHTNLNINNTQYANNSHTTTINISNNYDHNNNNNNQPSTKKQQCYLYNPKLLQTADCNTTTIKSHLSSSQHHSNSLDVSLFSTQSNKTKKRIDQIKPTSKIIFNNSNHLNNYNYSNSLGSTLGNNNNYYNNSNNNINDKHYNNNKQISKQLFKNINAKQIKQINSSTYQQFLTKQLKDQLNQIPSLMLKKQNQLNKNKQSNNNSNGINVSLIRSSEMMRPSISSKYQHKMQEKKRKTSLMNQKEILDNQLFNQQINYNDNNNHFICQKQQSKSKSKTLNYSNISPFFNFKKYTPICGFQVKTGQNGCLCINPCPLIKQWTKNYKQSDFKLFQQLVNYKISDKQIDQIDKDIRRTHSDCITFSNNQHFQQMLKQVLTCYVAYDPQIGYVQGMNMIVGIILYHIKNSQLSFWAFVDLMDQQQLRMIYLPGFHYLKKHQNNILNIMNNKVQDIIQKMNQLDIIPQSFLNGWLLSLMGTCIPLEYMHQVIDKFRVLGWNYIYQLIITYLLFLKQQLLRTDDQSDFLLSLNTKNSRQYGIIWEQLIQSACKFPIN